MASSGGASGTASLGTSVAHGTADGARLGPGHPWAVHAFENGVNTR